MKKLQFGSSEQPLIAQVWGLKPENFYKTAQELVAMGFAGIDLNMGCPVKDVVANGACSALMNNRGLAGEVIQATQEGAAERIPVSVKTRLGFNEVDYSWHEFLLQQKLNMLTIHARTRKEMSKVPADWTKLNEIRKLRDALCPDTLIVGNGDVMSRAEGLRLAEEHQLDGIMIGRGVFHDPYIFAETSPWPDMTRGDKIKLYKKHVQLFAATWQHGEHPVRVLNKFCKIYINGFEDAKEIREQLMAANSIDELTDLLDTARTA